MRAIRFMMILILAVSLLLSIPAFAAEKISIVCTSFPCYDFACAVVGEDADVRLLIKPGAEVHSYEPTPADVLAIASCDLFVYIGGESDAWVEDILSSFADEAPSTLRFFDFVEAIEQADHDAEEHPDDEGHLHDHEYDEHIWTSPRNAARMVSVLAEELCALAPEFSEDMRLRADDYIAQINELDARFQSIVSNGIRKEMIFADRFPFLYFAREYGLKWYAAFDSCSSESEPSAKTMMTLINHILEDEVPVVYTIELSNQKTAKTIAAETGVEICTFHSVQNVTEDDFSAGENYVSLMSKNATALEKGLN